MSASAPEFGTVGLSVQSSSCGGAGRALKNSAAILDPNGLQLRVRDHPISDKPLGPRGALIQIKAVGICGSDVHYQLAGRIGDFVVRAPMCLGHECSGVVIAVGSDVSNIAVGDRVAIEPGQGCGDACEFCTSGRYNLCAKMEFLATPPYHGALASYVVHPASRCFKLPASMSFEQGALLEPLSVAVQALKRADLRMGQSALICGAGPIGLAVALAARGAGARSTVLDVSTDRLQLAEKLLAPREGEQPDVFLRSPVPDAEAALVQKNGPFDVVFECSGAESATALALRSVRSGGTVVLIGMSSQNNLSLPVGANVVARELDVRGVMRYCHTYPTAMALVSSGRVPIERLVTHRVSLRASAQHQQASDQAAASAQPSDELGPLDEKALLQGFETAHKGADKETSRPCIKVMFSL